MNELIRPVADGHRLESLDLLRGIALLGILVVNALQYFQPLSLANVPIRFTPDDPLMWPVWGFIHALFDSKFLTVFSLLFGLGFALQWQNGQRRDPRGFKWVYLRRLLILAFVNAAPLAVSSTMFLFFVEGRWQAPGWEGALLVLFFLAAALSSPMWSRLADRFGNKPVLLAAMVAAVASFGVTFTLGPGDHIQFAIICVLSGATIGADLTLLPAMFAGRMARIAPNGGQGFGLWSLMNKFTLAFAAVLLLPLLEGAGYDADTRSYPEAAQWMLMVLYAVVPSVLKLVAIGLLAATRLEDAK